MTNEAQTGTTGLKGLNLKSDPSELIERISIRISHVVEREYVRRRVFPELRLDNAHRILTGATGVHRVSVERAREILADAEAQMRSSGIRRGLPLAYGALARNVANSLRQEIRRGLIEDPGMAGAQRLQIDASACLHVGDHVLYFRDNDEYGHEATVVEEYRMYPVTSDDGPYIDRDDERLEYRRGYIIRLKGDDYQFFVPAYRLTRDGCKPSHLRMVASRRPA